MQITFEVGDRVMLKTGGPAMTVEDADGLKIKCVWFPPSLGATGVYRDAFEPQTLVPAPFDR